MPTPWYRSLHHKVIGLRYIATGLFFLVAGGWLALLMRWQLGFPSHKLAFMGWLAPGGMPGGHMLPDYYNMLFTMHATIMIFFAVVPILWSGFGTYLVPLMIGSREMAFPRLTRAAYWIYVAAGLIALASFFAGPGAARSGWSAYTPLSARDPVGQTYWIISLMVLSLSSLLAAINFITTIVNQRATGMQFFRLPLTVWAILLTSVLLLLALPSLIVAISCLLSDRLGGTHFFSPLAGVMTSDSALYGQGQPLLWQHLFWFFGHPEVYIVILPAMGIVSDVISTFSRRPIFGYRSMVYAMVAISALGFLVWGHHMFVSGMNPLLGTTFMLSTSVIAVPSGIKLFNWLATLWGGSIRFTAALLAAAAFMSMFLIGGLTGIFLAMTPLDIYLHNTYFVVGHFHFMMAGGALFGLFAATYYWFPKMTGRLLDDGLGRWHVVLSAILFTATFYPMFVLGTFGEPRRMFEVSSYPDLVVHQPLQVFMTWAAFALFTVQGLFVYNIIGSWKKGAPAGDNPWNAGTLEWTTTSPPPTDNFVDLPTVYRGPYEYSQPEHVEDFCPQSKPS